MTPTEFKEIVVDPNIDAMKDDCRDIRLAFNCVLTLDALVAHIFYWDQSHSRRIIKAKNDLEYRGCLSGKHPDFALLRDIAKAVKHCELTRGSPLISKSSAIDSKPIGVLGTGIWNDNEYWHDEAKWNNGPDPLPQVVVDCGDGKCRTIEAIAEVVLGILETEISRVLNPSA